MSPTRPSSRGRTVPVLLASLVIVGGVNVAAYAATGGSFLLGKVNTENASATLKNTGNGPAVKFVTKPGAPPFAVSSGKRVARLNADKVDGLSAKTLLNPARSYVVTTAATTTSAIWAFDGLPPGVYQASFTVFAANPAGDPVNCGFLRADGTFNAATFGNEAPTGGVSSASGSAVLDLRTDPAALRCFNTGGFAITDAAAGNVHSEADFVRLNGFVPGTGTAVRPGPAAHRFGR